MNIVQMNDFNDICGSRMNTIYTTARVHKKNTFSYS